MIEIIVLFCLLLVVLAALFYGHHKQIDSFQAIAGMAGVPIVILLDVYIYVEVYRLLHDKFESFDTLSVFVFLTFFIFTPYIFLILYIGEKNNQRCR